MVESFVKSKILKPLLEELGYKVYAITMKLRAGFPDMIALRNGKTIFIEVKMENCQLTSLQKMTLMEIGSTANMALFVSYFPKEKKLLWRRVMGDGVFIVLGLDSIQNW